MPYEPEKFRNYYRCPYDSATWSDTWSCMCDDRCPVCNVELTPYRSEELCLECGAVVDDPADGACPACRAVIKDFDELQAELCG